MLAELAPWALRALASTYCEAGVERVFSWENFLVTSRRGRADDKLLEAELLTFANGELVRAAIVKRLAASVHGPELAPLLAAYQKEVAAEAAAAAAAEAAE